MCMSLVKEKSVAKSTKCRVRRCLNWFHVLSSSERDIHLSECSTLKVRRGKLLVLCVWCSQVWMSHLG